MRFEPHHRCITKRENDTFIHFFCRQHGNLTRGNIWQIEILNRRLGTWNAYFTFELFWIISIESMKCKIVVNYCFEYNHLHLYLFILLTLFGVHEICWTSAPKLSLEQISTSTFASTPLMESIGSGLLKEKTPFGVSTYANELVDHLQGETFGSEERWRVKCTRIEHLAVAQCVELMDRLNERDCTDWRS